MALDKPLRLPDYRLETIDDELLLFHPAKTQVIYCNQSASVIWQLCDGQRTEPEIVALLQETYPEAANEIAADVAATLQMFKDYDAITWV